MRRPRLVTLSAGLAAQIWRRNGGTLRIAWKRSRRLGLDWRPGMLDRDAAGIGGLCLNRCRRHPQWYRGGVATLGAEAGDSSSTAKAGSRDAPSVGGLAPPYLTMSG